MTKSDDKNEARVEDPAGAEEWARLIDSYKSQLNAFSDPRQQAQFHYVIGQLNEQRLRNDRSAVASYQTALKLDPSHRPSMRAIQRIFLRNDNWNGALKYTEQLISHSEESEQAEHWLEKGRLLELTTRDLDAAMGCYEESLRLAGPQLEILLALEGIYRKLQAWDKMVAIFHQQFPLLDDPDLKASAHVKLGRLYEQQLDQSGVAKEHYRTALRICPTHETAFHAIVSLLRRHFSWTELSEFYVKSVETPISDLLKAECLSRLADLHQDQFLKPEQALGYLEQLLALRPGHTLTMVRLETLYRELGQPAAAAPLIAALAQAAGTPRDAAEHFHRLGHLYEVELSDPDQARQAYRQAIAQQPDHREAIVALSRLDAISENWPAIAEGTLLLAQQQIGSIAKAQRLFEAAEIYALRLNDRETAEGHLVEAIALDPTGLPAIKLLTRLYVDAERYAELAHLIEQQLVHSNSREQTIFLLEKLAGVYQQYLGDAQQAAGCYRRILDVRADDLNALRALGRLLFQLGDWAALIAVNGREAELSRDISHIVNLLTRNGEIAEEQLDDDEQAVSWYEKALNVSPNFLPALRPLERLYARRKLWQELLRVYERQRQVVLDPQSRAGLEFIIGSLKATHLDDQPGAKIAFQSVLAAIPDHEPSQRALAGIYKALGDWESLRILWESQILQMPADAAARDMNFALGQLLDRQLKRPYQAVAAYLRALQIDPQFQPVKDAIVRVLYKAEDYPSLIDFYQQELDNAADVDAQRHALQQLAALWRNQLNNLEQAARYYERLIELDPGDFTAFGALEEIYTQLGQFEQLVERYKAIAQQTTTKAFALNCLLRAAELCLRQLGSSERALELFGVVLANDPQNLHAMNRMEEIFYRRQKWRDLMMLLRQRAQVLGDGPDQGDLRYRLALVYELLNKADAAMPPLRQLVETDPGNIPAALAVARLLAAQGDKAAATRTIGAIPRTSGTTPSAPKVIIDERALIPDTGDDATQQPAPEAAASPQEEPSPRASGSKKGSKRKGKRKR